MMSLFMRTPLHRQLAAIPMLSHRRQDQQTDSPLQLRLVSTTTSSNRSRITRINPRRTSLSTSWRRIHGTFPKQPTILRFNEAIYIAKLKKKIPFVHIYVFHFDVTTLVYSVINFHASTGKTVIFNRVMGFILLKMILAIVF